MSTIITDGKEYVVGEAVDLVEVVDTSKHLNMSLPLATNNGKEVKIISTEGRIEGYPIIGYIGDSVHQSEWSLEGKARLGYGYSGEDLSVKPLIGEVWVTAESHSADCLYLDFKLHHAQAMDKRRDAEPVGRVRVPFVIAYGQRDDLPE